MILPSYPSCPFRIAGAFQALFIDQDVEASRIIVATDAIRHVWALGDTPVADTLTAVDYCHLLAPEQEENLRDAEKGERIAGSTWNESLRTSSQTLLGLLD
jgi:hypothetical protein